MNELMKGFPPTPETQVTLENWRKSPFNKWGFHHVREIVPSADIIADSKNILLLPFDSSNLDHLTFSNNAGNVMDFKTFLEHSETDGLVILRKGKIVYEYYANGMSVHTPHILMSVSKSLLGLLLGAMVERGDLQLTQAVTEFVPEVTETAYEGATIRDLLDMRVGIGFEEDYLADTGPMVEYRKSTNWNPLAPGQTPSDLRSFFSELKKRSGPHNGPINYVSPNSDLLGWIMERAAGQPYAELMSELIWRPSGAEVGAYITVDRLGAPRCAGGMCTTTRDLARIGQLINFNGIRSDKIVVPKCWIDDIKFGGDREAWQNGNMEVDFPGLDILYRSHCYTIQGESPLFFGFGIHGQFLFADSSNDIVIAKFSSQSLPIDVLQNMLTMAVAKKIIEELC